MAWSRTEGEIEGHDGGGGGGGGGGEEGNGGDEELDLETTSSFAGCPSLYILADCPATNALYVAFRGTKVQSDFLVLADVVPLSPPWPEEKGKLGSVAHSAFLLILFLLLRRRRLLLLRASSKEQGKESSTAAAGKFAAHRGFARRAAGIPIEAIAAHAAAKGRRLVVSFFFERERERGGVFFFLFAFFFNQKNF